jgi:hypothetical protein
VTHVLRVPTLKVCHPVTLIVLMESDDLSFDAAAHPGTAPALAS